MKKILMIGAAIVVMTTSANAGEFIPACAKADVWQGHFDNVQKGITDMSAANMAVPDSLRKTLSNIAKELVDSVSECRKARG
jgi:hypothetical protein